jgi:hypothetical protein
MTTSGSIDFTVSTKDIVQEALEIIGVIGPGQSIEPDLMKSTLRSLNMLTKLWQADGLNLFAVQETFLFPKLAQKKYTLTDTSTDNFTASFNESTTSAAAIATATTVVLTLDAGLAVGDAIGIKLENSQTLHWTTVSDITGTPSIVITDALPDSVVAGAAVYSYTAKAGRPMKILEGYTVRAGSSGPVDVPIGIVGRTEYGELANKDASGVTNQVYFDPQVQTASLSIWPTTDTEVDYLRLFVQRTLSDFDCVINTPDYPQEWYHPLAYNLAVVVASKHGVPREIFQRVALVAGDMYNTAKGFDEESETSVYFAPDSRGHG